MFRLPRALRVAALGFALPLALAGLPRVDRYDSAKQSLIIYVVTVPSLGDSRCWNVLATRWGPK